MFCFLLCFTTGIFYLQKCKIRTKPHGCMGVILPVIFGHASAAHRGTDASILTSKPVTGCWNHKLSAWSSWPSYILPFHWWTPSYFTSPLIGIPRYRQCNRIWCVLPLRGKALTTTTSSFSMLEHGRDGSSAVMKLSVSVSVASPESSGKLHSPLMDTTWNWVSMSLTVDPPGSMRPTSDAAYTRQAPNFDRPWPDLMVILFHLGAWPTQRAMYDLWTLWSVNALTSLEATLCDLVMSMTPLVSRSRRLARWSSREPTASVPDLQIVGIYSIQSHGMASQNKLGSNKAKERTWHVHNCWTLQLTVL